MNPVLEVMRDLIHWEMIKPFSKSGLFPIVFLKQFCLCKDIATKNQSLFVDSFELNIYNDNIANNFRSNLLPLNGHLLNESLFIIYKESSLLNGVHCVILDMNILKIKVMGTLANFRNVFCNFFV